MERLCITSMAPKKVLEAVPPPPARTKWSSSTRAPDSEFQRKFWQPEALTREDLYKPCLLQKSLGKIFAAFNSQTPVQESRDHGIKANMTPSNDTNNALGTDFKEMEIYNLPEKEYEIIIVKRLNGRQESIIKGDQENNKWTT